MLLIHLYHVDTEIHSYHTDIKDNTGNVSAFPETPQPLAAELARQIPRIEKASHFLYLYGGRTLGTKERSFKEYGIASGSDFLKVRNFKLISGDRLHQKVEVIAEIPTELGNTMVRDLTYDLSVSHPH